MLQADSPSPARPPAVHLPAMAPAGAMSNEMSLYLDFVRFSAAVVVFLGHFATQAISGGLFWQIAPFRHDAVIVFFVLSGFVIAFAVDKSEHDPVTYFVNRAARIYSVAVPAIVITLLLDAIAIARDPDYRSWGFSDGSLWEQVLTALTFTNQAWGLHLFPGSNGPYWSLGFEVPYYVIFAAAIFLRGTWRIVVPLGLVVAVGPTVAALLPLWLLGVALFHCGRSLRSPVLGWALFIGAPLAWAGIETWALCYDGWILDYAIAGLARDRIPADYVTAVAFALHIGGFRIIASRFGGVPDGVQRVVRWLAGRTFTLYLLHFPVLRFLTAELPWGHDSWPTRMVSLVGTVVVVLVTAELFELRKRPWRRFFAAVAARAGLAVPTRG